MASGAAVAGAGAARAELAAVSAELAAARSSLDDAKLQAAASDQAQSAALAELAQRLVREKVAGCFESAEVDGVRALSKLRAPPPICQQVVRCACMLLSVDIPGATFHVSSTQAAAALGGGAAAPNKWQKAMTLMKWDECKKLVLSRSDLSICLSRFDLSRLRAAPALVASIANRCLWHTALPAGSEDSLPPPEHPAGEATVDVEQARGSHTAAGVLFVWCARVLSALRELEAAAAAGPSAAARADRLALDQRIEELAGAVAALRRARSGRARRRRRRRARRRRSGDGGRRRSGGSASGRSGCVVRRRSGGARAAGAAAS